MAEKVDTRFRRLESHEVVLAWDMLFAAIKKSELYSDDTSILNMLMDAVGGRYQCWIFLDGDGMKGVVMTQIFSVLNRRKLMVVHANSFEGGIGDDGWGLIWRKLLQFGQGEHCNEFEVFTENPRVKAILRGLEFDEKAMFRKEITPCQQAAAQAAK